MALSNLKFGPPDPLSLAAAAVPALGQLFGGKGQQVASAAPVPVSVAPSTPVQLSGVGEPIQTAPSSGFSTLGSGGGGFGAGGGAGAAQSFLQSGVDIGMLLSSGGGGGKGASSGKGATNQAMFRAGPNQTLDF